MDIAHAHITGKLSQDPEVKFHGSTAICEIGIAVNRRKKEFEEWIDEVNFFNVTIFGKEAEFVGQYGYKGQPVTVFARLKMDEWNDRDTGQKRKKVALVSQTVTLQGRKDGQSSQSNQSSGESYGQRTSETVVEEYPEDLPF